MCAGSVSSGGPNEEPSDETNCPRRRVASPVLKHTGRIAAASALAAGSVAHVHAAENNTIRVALIGCGGRGTGAAANALATRCGPVKLVAMADVFPQRLEGSCAGLKEFGSQVDVHADRKFIGFDAYRKAIDCLKAGDVAIFATPPAFRWVHFGYAIRKGINVFMEKPVAVDGPTTRKMLALAEQSVQKNLKVAVGLMVRHCKGRQELHRADPGRPTRRARSRCGPTAWAAARYGRPQAGRRQRIALPDPRFHAFLWASGGVYSDYYIHQIDECSWMKPLHGRLPPRVRQLRPRHQGRGGDQHLGPLAGQGPHLPGTHDGEARAGLGVSAARAEPLPASSGTISSRPSGRTSPTTRRSGAPRPAWSPPWAAWPPTPARSSPTSKMLNQRHEFAPDVDKLTMDSPAPLRAGPDGKYPVPQPGIVRDREY